MGYFSLDHSWGARDPKGAFHPQKHSQLSVPVSEKTGSYRLAPKATMGPRLGAGQVPHTPTHA